MVEHDAQMGEVLQKLDHLLVPAQAYIASWLSSFNEFPPRQKPASFSLDQVMKKLTERPGAQIRCQPDRLHSSCGQGGQLLPRPRDRALLSR